MPNKFVGAFKFFTKGSKKGKVAPTITQPRQLKTTMKRIQSENKRFGFTKAKTATDRANIVRKKKSIERMEKLDAAKKKVKAGEKGKKDIQIISYIIMYKFPAMFHFCSSRQMSHFIC